jgi:hypothetical protein
MLLTAKILHRRITFYWRKKVIRKFCSKKERSFSVVASRSWQLKKNKDVRLCSGEEDIRHMLLDCLGHSKL